MRTAGLGALTKRNVKLYFKDKGMLFSSLITPLILLVLYTTFLKNVFWAHNATHYIKYCQQESKNTNIAPHSNKKNL